MHSTRCDEAVSVTAVVLAARTLLFKNCTLSVSGTEVTPAVL
jgi:hypothetical protein